MELIYKNTTSLCRGKKIQFGEKQVKQNILKINKGLILMESGLIMLNSKLV